MSLLPSIISPSTVRAAGTILQVESPTTEAQARASYETAREWERDAPWLALLLSIPVGAVLWKKLSK